MNYHLPTQRTIEVHEKTGEKPILYDAKNEPLARSKQAGFVKDQNDDQRIEDSRSNRNA